MIAQTETTPEELDIHKILKDSRGDSTGKLIDLIPAAMSDLSKQMIDNPDARIRSRIHRQMRGLFDFMQADTKNPIEKNNKKDEPLGL